MGVNSWYFLPRMNIVGLEVGLQSFQCKTYTYKKAQLGAWSGIYNEVNPMVADVQLKPDLYRAKPMRLEVAGLTDSGQSCISSQGKPSLLCIVLKKRQPSPLGLGH